MFCTITTAVEQARPIKARNKAAGLEEVAAIAVPPGTLLRKYQEQQRWWKKRQLQGDSPGLWKRRLTSNVLHR